MASNVHAYQTYASTPVKSTKDTEIEIILETTRRLKHAEKERDTNFSKFASTLQENRKMWITLATDVANTNNGLPQELRARIFYLFEYTQFYTRKVLSENLSIEPLVDINLAVLRGLTTKWSDR